MAGIAIRKNSLFHIETNSKLDRAVYGFVVAVGGCAGLNILLTFIL